MVVIKHTTIAILVGISAESAVHFKLPVSFFIVKRVVAHGQCNKLNNIVFRAVR